MQVRRFARPSVADGASAGDDARDEPNGAANDPANGVC